jgi:hypothetical protein
MGAKIDWSYLMKTPEIEELIKNELAALAITDAEVEEQIRADVADASSLEEARALIRKAALDYKTAIVDSIELRALSF